MTRKRKDLRSGLAQPRGATVKTVTKRLRMEPVLAETTEQAARDASQTWTAWATEALELAIARGGTR